VTTIAIDTGGTFTDCVLVRPGAPPVVAKVASTPADPSEAMVAGIRRLLAEAGARPEEVGAVAHGTTVATNAMLERRWARVGLITTEGFRDVLEIGDQMRPELYGLRQRRPEPLVRRALRKEVAGRLWADGTVDVELDEDAVRGAARDLQAEGVESIAVAFLFSFVDDRHERRALELVRETVPGVYACASADVSPTVREHPRTSTTVVNAALAPVVERYLTRLQVALRQEGMRGARLRVMQSNGGTATAAQAGATAHKLLVSGPAAGVIAAQALAREGHDRLLTFDMGGTSTDVGMVVGGHVAQRHETLADGAHPVVAPTADIHTIGAGGGSLAWRSEDGRLRVGPQSAGADPGPACYGNGGRQATVTDADVLLGRLGPDTPLGGELHPDPELARAALAELGEQLGLDAHDAAAGVLAVAHATMSGALRVVTSRRGHDPRDFALVAYGGAGPLHAAALARELGIDEVLVPALPGAFSAVGLLEADLRHDVLEAVNRSLASFAGDELERALLALEADGDRRLARDGVPAADRGSSRHASVRYAGQDFALEVPAGAPADPVALAERFHREHEQVYGQAARGEPVELVALRVEALGAVARHDLGAPGSAPAPPARERDVWFAGRGWCATPVLGRAALGADAVASGPLVVEQPDCTVLVEPGQEVRVDEDGTLVLRFSEAA
jgi:N-methylhydantoinase A